VVEPCQMHVWHGGKKFLGFMLKSQRDTTVRQSTYLSAKILAMPSRENKAHLEGDEEENLRQVGRTVQK